MFKVVRSYSKKAERKSEGGQRNGYATYDGGHTGSNGALLAVDNKHLSNVSNAYHAGGGFSESSSYETREHFERKVQKVKKSRGERERSRSARRGDEVSEVLAGSDATSARDALLQWARKVTTGYPRVSVNNFSSSWRDGLAFNAILHRYRPNLIDWKKISDPSVSNRERLDHAFAAAESEFGVSRLLDAEDVDQDHPDEKSIITYVSSLYNALPHLPELSRGNLDDLISRLTRGIGITNEKLDHILRRIEETEARVDSARPGEIERAVNEIVDDLNTLESPIQGFFEDVDELQKHNHPEANDFYRLVYGLHQRRTAYLDRLTNQLLVRLGLRTETLRKENAARVESIRKSTFSRVEECIEWVRVRMTKLTDMVFLEDLETLEEMFEQHKHDNRDIQDFRQNVDECIARQAEVSAEDTYEYCELLRVLESEYQQLRDLSAGRMLDLDSLIAFVRAAQMELVWVSEREEVEVTRNWSDIRQLDLPMLTNYYKQLLHEMELREKQYNDVHNQGAALLNQGHPAVHVIEVYLRTMQNQWDWLLSLSKCLEEHLRDALNLQSFMEEAHDAERWMEEQSARLENNYNRSDFPLEEGERYLRELDEIKDILQKYHSVLMALTERCATISPLWQRGERISSPITVVALCDYSDKNMNIKAGDEVTLLDNSDLVKWVIRDISGHEGTVPSVVFRIPPPDPKLTAFLQRLLQQFEKLRKLWEKKHRMVRFNMVLNTMKTIQGWDLDTFNAIDPEQRDLIMRALNDDAGKLLSELDPNDPLYLRLKEELRRTNEHFWNLLNASQKPPEPDYSNQFDEKMSDLLKKLEEAWRKLNEASKNPVPRTAEELERIIVAHKQFEDALQGLDADVGTVKELFRQIPNPSATQRHNHDRMNGLWEDLWDLSRMYVERIKVLELVLNGMVEVADIVKAHEITLNSFDDLPAALDKLRGHHAQLLEMNMVLQQQQTVVDQLNKNVALFRQHVQRTRIDQPNHPDVDNIEDEVQRLNVRWENVGAQVLERLQTTERALQTAMVYRSEYEHEIKWLDSVEATINSLRRPENLRPEEYQQQLDMLVAEYSHVQEHTEAIQNVNREGGKYIRDAKSYDSRMTQFLDAIVGIHGMGIKNDFRRTKPQPKNGAQIVTEELEALNRRFAQLSTMILERRNELNVLIQEWKRKQQEEEDRRRADEEAKRRAFEAARLKALEDADRLRRDREGAEAARRSAEEAERLRRLAEEAERARRAAEEAERRRREEEERRRREEEERKRREEEERKRREEEERRRREDEERRRREEEERRKLKPNTAIRMVEVVGEEGTDDWEKLGKVPEVAKITEHEDEMQMYQEETVTKTQFYEMEGNLKKQTGEILTFVEAVRQGLLDLHAGGGQYFDLVSGSRISLEKAAELGHIDGDFQQIISGHHGIRHPETGQSLSLLEAIQIGLYDSDCRMFRDINTQEIIDDDSHIISLRDRMQLVKRGVLKNAPMSLSTAIAKNFLNTSTGVFTGQTTNESYSLKDALYHDYLKIITRTPNLTPSMATTLSDVIENDFVNANNGEFNDRNTKDNFTLRDAFAKKNGLINMGVAEIVDTNENSRITLGIALPRHAINQKDGNYLDLKTRRSMSLRDAYRENLIGKPMTLTELSSRDLIDSHNLFVDRGTQQRHTLLEAIVAGLIDAEVRHIVDPDEKDVISIAEALERGVLGADGNIILEKQQRSLTIPEAIREGLLTKRVRHSIFDIRGIQNTETRTSLSFVAAIEAGIIVPNAERVVDVVSHESYFIGDDRAKNLIDPYLHDLLTKPIGIKGERGEYDMNLVRAVSKGMVDPVKAVFISNKREMSPREAYQAGLVSLRGALLVSGLFDVHSSLIAPVKKVDKKKRISRPGQNGLELAEDQVKVTLDEAMKKGLIDARSQRFRQGDIDVSLQDALAQGLIDPNSEWIVPSKSAGVGPTIEEKTTESVTETGQQLAPKYFPDKNLEESVTTIKRVRTTETTALGGPGGVSMYRAITGGKGAIEAPSSGYHIYDAERRNILDLTSGDITAPNVDRKISFSEGVELGIINSDTIKVKDQSGRLVGVKDAIEKGAMNKDGSVSSRGRQYSLEKAIEERLIVIDDESALVPVANQSKNIIQIPSGAGPVISFRPVGTPAVEEHEEAWAFDSNKGIFVDQMTGERLSLEAALATGKIAQEDLSVRDALTGREMSFIEAEKWGVITFNNRDKFYLDKSDQKRMSFTEAAQQHRIYPTGGVPENAGDAVHTTVKMQTKTQVSKREALSGGAPLTDNTLGKALMLGWYDNSNGMFTHPDTHKQMTLKEAIIKGLFNPYDTTVHDSRSGKDVSLLEAIEQGLVDDTTGTVLDTKSGRKLNLASAHQEGILKGKSYGDSLDSSLMSGRLDLSTGTYSHNGSSVPFHEALNKNIVDKSSVVIRNPADGREMTYEEAVSYKVVDPSKGVVLNRSTNESTPFASALTSGMIASAGTSKPQRLVEQKLQLTPFAPHQVQRGGSGDRHEFVDLGGGKQVRVKVVRDEQGAEKGEYVDPSTGMKFTIQMHGDPFVTETKTSVKSTSQVQSVELEPHAEFVGIDRIRDKRNNRIMSLEDAKRMGLARVDKKGKQMTKSYSVFRSNIQNAVTRGVMDAHMEKISLEDAIRAGIVDIRDLTYKHTKSGEAISFTQAANMGLVDVTLSETLSKGVVHPATAEPITIKKAIELGIIDPRTGEVRNPVTRERINWIDLVKPVYQAITSDGVFDHSKGTRVPVTSALNDGLINSKTSTYHNSLTGENITLDDAVDHGFLDRNTYDILTKPCVQDYRTSRKLNLIEAVAANIVDTKNRTIQTSRHSIVPIAKAVQEGKIPSDIGEKLRQVDKITFAEALGKGLIDVSKNIFTDPDTDRQMTIAQAIQEGHIDTGSVEAMEGSNEKNLANVVNSDEFDDNSGRIRDSKTGLYLTFGNAVERDVIDGDSLLHIVDSGKTVTLREALRNRVIDSDGKFVSGNDKMKIKDAVLVGHIALIESPMQAAQAVTEAVKRREAEGYRFKMEPVSGDQHRGSRTSVPKFREETTTITKLTPHKVEPGLSVRMRQNVVPSGERIRSLVDDPSALADLQQEFLDRLLAERFDIDDKIIQIPSDHRRISVREAAETGVLDVTTGEFIDNNRRYSIPKAMNKRMLGEGAAKRLMEGLNMSIDEFNQQAGPMVTSPSGSAFSPEEPGSTRSWTKTKTVNWHGQPTELRSSRTDPLAEYTTYSTNTQEESTYDTPSWARRE